MLVEFTDVLEFVLGGVSFALFVYRFILRARNKRYLRIIESRQPANASYAGAPQGAPTGATGWEAPPWTPPYAQGALGSGKIGRSAATAALVFGIVSLFGFAPVAPLAIGFGAMACGSGVPGSKGRAVAGIVMGCIGLAYVVLAAAAGKLIGGMAL